MTSSTTVSTSVTVVKKLKRWMLNLIAHFVAENESWLDSFYTAKDWRQLGLSCINDYWEVPPPLWLVEREEEGKKESEKMEESFECATASPVLNPSESAEESLDITTVSPLDRDWGKELPAPSTAVAAPSTPVWRPWEHPLGVFSRYDTISIRYKGLRKDLLFEEFSANFQKFWQIF